MAKCQRCRRLQAVRRLEVREVSEELLEVVIRHPGLKEMRIHTDISSVHPQLLAKAVLKLEEVELRETLLTPQQATAICTALKGNSKTKVLDMSTYNKMSSPLDLSTVDADILAQAVAQMEEVGLEGTKLTPQQVEAVFAALDASCHLKVLRIGHNTLSSLDPDVLARVVNKLETVDLIWAHLSRQQQTRIFARSLLTINLRHLNMKGAMMGNGGSLEQRKTMEEICRQARKVIPELYF